MSHGLVFHNLNILVYCQPSLLMSPDSKYLEMVEQKLAGAIVLNLEPDGKNTPTSIYGISFAAVMLHSTLLITIVTNEIDDVW